MLVTDAQIECNLQGSSLHIIKIKEIDVPLHHPVTDVFMNFHDCSRARELFSFDKASCGYRCRNLATETP